MFVGIHNIAMKRSFYLIRHGETDWNRKTKRLQGHTDIPLNEIGRAQAQSLGPLIQDLGITRFVSSDLSRAHETAKIIAGGLPITTDPRLREVKLGSVEGLAPDAVDAQYGADFRRNWGSNHEDYRHMKFPDGESRHEVIVRAYAAIHDALDLYPKDVLAFVAHGFLIRSLAFEKKEIATDYFVPNCAVAPFSRELDRGILYLGSVDPLALIQPPRSLIGE